MTAPSSQGLGGQQQQKQKQGHHVDYEQAGIDFVLTYDNPDDPSKAYISPPPQ